MFQVYTEFEKEWGAPRDVAATRSLDPELQTFDQWLVDNIGRVPTT
jgi:hypothetical protein